MFFFVLLGQAAAVTVPPVHRDLHTVLCISPSKGRSRELHKVRHGQNHPGPEITQCVFEYKYITVIFQFDTQHKTMIYHNHHLLIYV